MLDRLSVLQYKNLLPTDVSFYLYVLQNPSPREEQDTSCCPTRIYKEASDEMTLKAVLQTITFSSAPKEVSYPASFIQK